MRIKVTLTAIRYLDSSQIAADRTEAGVDVLIGEEAYLNTAKEIALAFADDFVTEAHELFCSVEKVPDKDPELPL